MIANICAFMLCCFAITSIIKTIESAGNQIAPIRFVNHTAQKNYVRTVNELKTFNKKSVVINYGDVKVLSSLTCNSNKKYELKLKSRAKLEKKGQDIKCSFCVIAKINIPYLNNITEKIKRREPFIQINLETVKRLEEEAKIILRILLLGDLETGKWLWIYFLKIVAISQYNYNNPIIVEPPFEDDLLQTGVSATIRNCIAENYLPPTAMESDWVSDNMSIIHRMFRVLRKSQCVSDVCNDGALVTIEFLYLSPFWDDIHQFLFSQIIAVNVDWSEPKRRHEAEVAVTREFVANRTWTYNPYGRLDHQRFLVKIIDATFYCYISVMLHVYEKQLSIPDEAMVNYVKHLINNVIHSALQITAFKDEFLVIISSELELAKINDVDDVKDILARVITKTNEILNDLNCTSTSEIDRLSFAVDEHQLLNFNLIFTIIMNFMNYLTQLKIMCSPFEYKVLLHFVDEVKPSCAQYI